MRAADLDARQLRHRRNAGAILAASVLVLVCGLGPEIRAAATAPAAGAPKVRLVLRVEDGSPVPGGRPVFGPVEVEIEIGVGLAGLPVSKVEVFLDGNRVGLLEAPPYRVLVDAGQQNVDHRFEAVVFGASGPLASAAWRTAKVAVDLAVDVRLQHVYVTVERGGTAGPGPGRSDFSVFDDGVRQKIAVFDHGSVPLATVVLLDASSSMEGARLATALDGARAFVAALRAHDEAKLLLFSDQLLRETPFTSLPVVLAIGLDGVAAGGGTALNDTLYLALRRLAPHSGRQVLMLLSDGVDVESVLPMASVRARLRESQATLYWLRLKEDEHDGAGHSSSWRNVEGHRRELAELRAAVLESGGRIEDLDRLEQVQDKLGGLLQELRRQYVLGYYPDHSRGRGSWHKLRVELRGGGTLRAARGYAEP